MSNIIKSFFVSLIVLISTNILAGVVTVNGESCGVLAGALTVDTTGNIMLNTDGSCGTPTFELKVTASGYGEIISDIGGMLIRETTSATPYLSTQQVVLTATPDDGEEFSGWTNCSSVAVSPDTCTVDMSSAHVVAGEFSMHTAPVTYSLTVQSGGTGAGTITIANITCGAGKTCSESFKEGSDIRVTATPSGSDTVSWTQCPKASGSICDVTMNGDANIYATFTAAPNETHYPTFAWPNIQQKSINLKGDESIIYQVKTTDTIDLGGHLSTAFTTSNSANRIVTISTTPGDFNMKSLGKCSASGSETASVAWTQNPNPPFPYNIIGICILKPDTTYYINVKHTNCADRSTCSFYLSN